MSNNSREHSNASQTKSLHHKYRGHAEGYAAAYAGESVSIALLELNGANNLTIRSDSSWVTVLLALGRGKGRCCKTKAHSLLMYFASLRTILVLMVKFDSGTPWMADAQISA